MAHVKTIKVVDDLEKGGITNVPVGGRGSVCTKKIHKIKSMVD